MKRLRIYFAGTPSNSREQTLTDAKVGGRLVTFAERTRALYTLRKWGRLPEKK